MVDLSAALQAALIERRVLRITYRRPGDLGEGVDRDVEVYAFDERYIDAYCRLREDPRCFRIDRIVEATLLAEKFSIDPTIESIIGAHGWANRTKAWRKDRMASLHLDEMTDELFFDRSLASADPKRATGCLGLLLAAMGMTTP